MNEQRIKLAKAMGWRYLPTDGRRWYQWVTPDGLREGGMALTKKHIVPPIDPFTNANDDFAVLEWMRGEARRDGISLLKDAGLLQIGAWQYQIGDFARAALTVIKKEND